MDNPRGGARGRHFSRGWRRIVGLVLIVLGGAGSVVAATFLSVPQWGVVAALALAGGTAIGVYGLLLVPRLDEAGDIWSPNARSRAWNSRRSRRHTVSYGVFLLVLGSAVVVVVLATEEAPVEELVRLWILAGSSAVFGVVLLIVGLRSPQASRGDADIPPPDPTGADTGWIPLGSDGSALTVNGAANAAVGVPQTVLPLMWIILLPTLLRLPVWACLITAGLVIVAVAVFFVTRRAKAAPLVAHDGSAIRVKSTRVDAPAVVSARLLVSPPFRDAPQRSVTLILEGPAGFRAFIGVRHRGRRVLSTLATHALLELIALSSIDLPRDKEDPSGRFSRVLHPTHLTKTQARELIERAPADGEPLPLDDPRLG